MARMLTMNCHTLCVADGFIVAGGLFIAFSHDKLIMNGNTKLKVFLNEIKNGFPIPYGLLQLCKMGASEATSRRLITGERLSP